MRILLCNDDGIGAEGILALYDALADYGGHAGAPMGDPILPIAPYSVQSATGHGITFRHPLITKPVTVADRMKGIAVDGRPADCVKLGLAALWPERFGKRSRPDLVVSGMNMGANVGINVLYSGTCAAALEAAFLGVPAFAVSLHLGTGEPLWDVAARRARRVMEMVLAWHRQRSPKGKRRAGVLPPLPPHTCININIPITERDGPMPRVRVVPMNVHGHVDNFTRHVNPLGETYYWSAGTPMDFHDSEPGKDVHALVKGAITVTPLLYDLTNPAGMKDLAAALRPGRG